MRNNVFVIDSDQDLIKIVFQLPNDCLIYVEAVDKNTLQSFCFHTYSCDNVNLLQDVFEIKRFGGIMGDRDFLDILDFLGYI